MRREASLWWFLLGWLDLYGLACSCHGLSWCNNSIGLLSGRFVSWSMALGLSADNDHDTSNNVQLLTVMACPLTSCEKGCLVQLWLGYVPGYCLYEFSAVGFGVVLDGQFIWM